MSSNPVDRAIDDAAADFYALAYREFGRATNASPKKPESPIEEALLAAFCATNIMAPIFIIPGMVEVTLPGRPIASIALQEQIAGYRVDFLLTCTKDGEEFAKIVVECDGHEFHDKTKEQAARDKARDRALTAAGCRVLRFTGSEIYRGAYQCVCEVVRTIVNLAPKRGNIG